MSAQAIRSANAPTPIGPYSQAILVNNMLFVSGQIAADASAGGTNALKYTIEQEVHGVMKNLGAILEAAGLDFSHVVKCTIFLKDFNHFASLNEVYGSYFPNNPPARETVEVSRLPKDVNVEISCIAVAP